MGDFKGADVLSASELRRHATLHNKRFTQGLERKSMKQSFEAWTWRETRHIPSPGGQAAANEERLCGSGSGTSWISNVIGKMRQLPQHRVADYESKSLKVLNYW